MSNGKSALELALSRVDKANKKIDIARGQNPIVEAVDITEAKTVLTGAAIPIILGGSSLPTVGIFVHMFPNLPALGIGIGVTMVAAAMASDLLNSKQISWFWKKLVPRLYKKSKESYALNVKTNEHNEAQFQKQKMKIANKIEPDIQIIREALPSQKLYYDNSKNEFRLDKKHPERSTIQNAIEEIKDTQKAAIEA